jgi:hypothetical protein
MPPFYVISSVAWSRHLLLQARSANRRPPGTLHAHAILIGTAWTDATRVAALRNDLGFGPSARNWRDPTSAACACRDRGIIAVLLPILDHARGRGRTGAIPIESIGIPCTSARCEPCRRRRRLIWAEILTSASHVTTVRCLLADGAKRSSTSGSACAKPLRSVDRFLQSKPISIVVQIGLYASPSRAFSVVRAWIFGRTQFPNTLSLIAFFPRDAIVRSEAFDTGISVGSTQRPRIGTIPAAANYVATGSGFRADPVPAGCRRAIPSDWNAASPAAEALQASGAACGRRIRHALACGVAALTHRPAGAVAADTVEAVPKQAIAVGVAGRSNAAALIDA